jgi:hypothetical protein
MNCPTCQTQLTANTIGDCPGCKGSGSRLGRIASRVLAAPWEILLIIVFLIVGARFYFGF